MIDEIVRETTILWESRDPRNVPEIARERISKYFSETDGNVPTIFVRYQVSAEGLRFLDRLLGRRPIFEDWISQKVDGGINIVTWGRKKEKIACLDDYLTHSQCVSLTFMYGSHYNGNCVIEWDSGSSRIGKVSRSR